MHHKGDKRYHLFLLLHCTRLCTDVSWERQAEPPPSSLLHSDPSCSSLHLVPSNSVRMLRRRGIVVPPPPPSLLCSVQSGCITREASGLLLLLLIFLLYAQFHPIRSRCILREASRYLLLLYCAQFRLILFEWVVGEASSTFFTLSSIWFCSDASQERPCSTYSFVVLSFVRFCLNASQKRQAVPSSLCSISFSILSECVTGEASSSIPFDSYRVYACLDSKGEPLLGLSSRPMSKIMHVIIVFNVLKISLYHPTWAVCTGPALYWYQFSPIMYVCIYV